MNLELAIARIIHIGFGAFWVGSAVFLVFVVEPRVRALGPAIQGPVMGAIGKAAGPLLGGSGAISIAAGIYLALRLRWNTLDSFFDTGWGWAIGLGFVLSIAAFFLGLTTGLLVGRMGKMAAALSGGPPSPDDKAAMGKLSGQIRTVGRTTAIILLLAVGTMASARFV